MSWVVGGAKRTGEGRVRLVLMVVMVVMVVMMNVMMRVRAGGGIEGRRMPPKRSACAGRSGRYVAWRGWWS